MGRWSGGLVGLALLTLLSLLVRASTARAESPLALASDLRGVALGPHMALLEDPGGRLTVEQVSAPASAARFVPGSRDAPSFGFTDSIYWIRLVVHNPSDAPRAWLLELANPLLDEVTLYTPRRDGGFDVAKSGDMLPFSQRDLAYRNVVFRRDETPRTTHTYYLRIATTSSMSLPLVAWSTRRFLEHQQTDWTALCMFYGVILVMALYSACVFAITRQREYLPFTGYVLSIGVVELTLAGHTFQLLLPDDPALVHRILPASLALGLLLASRVVASQLPGRSPRARRLSSGYFGLLFVVSCLGPPSTAVVLLSATAVALPLSLVLAFVLLRRGNREARLYMIVWASAMLGAMVSALHSFGLVSSNFFTRWSTQIGISVQLVLVSASLADKFKAVRADLAHVNEQLSHKLDALTAALSQAEEASARAARATRARDEFMATISHEFRTPLNPIVNIPRGLLEDFVPVRSAACAQCGSRFELDEDEPLGAGTACPECGAVGALHPEESFRFVGDATRTHRYLGKIERSGVQLLEVVNGILDFSKMEAGHLKLSREPVLPAALVRELQDEMQPVAERAGIVLHVEPVPCGPPLDVDPRRIRQALAVLVGNAIKFSRPGSAVHVRVEATPGAYVFAVEDQGIGIAKEHHEAIFRSFEQVHKGNTRRYGGTGIGLSIARSLVQMHGGSIRVESELGRGAAFFVRLPCCELSALPADAHSRLRSVG